MSKFANPSRAPVMYKSTRGGESNVDFETVLFSTYAKDGGLFVPETIPSFSLDDLYSWRDKTFPEICAQVMHMFTDIDLADLNEMTSRAYSSFNGGNDPLLLTPIGDENDKLILLDASLGPTLAFKDIGQQIVGQLLNYFVAKSGKKANIMVDTSGDTGPAAIAAVRGCDNLDITVLYPYQRVSPIQELQMITVLDSNVHIYRTLGNNDDQSNALKEVFSDHNFVGEHNVVSINSINWARIAAQSTYYVWAYLQIFNTKLSIGRNVDFSIPSGAFGNGAGGLLAKKMGLPIGRILCATNANDIVHRTICTGDMRMLGNHTTISPAMDIQFAYNLERLLYFMCGENTAYVKEVMEDVENEYNKRPNARGAQINEETLSKIQETFSSISVNDANTLATIARVRCENGYALCPHSAIGVFGARSLHRKPDNAWSSTNPLVCVLTAHASKFSETYNSATGEAPPLCSWSNVEELRSRDQRFELLEKDDGDDAWQARWVSTLKEDVARRCAGSS